MARLEWDKVGEHFYETGVSNGALYVMDNEGKYKKGVAWSGLTTVTESPSGAESNPFYADNIKYLNLISAEEFGGTIEAYTYPDEFAECDGSKMLTEGVMLGQQTRKPFGFVYMTNVGNDVAGADHGAKLHIIYGCTASPSEKSYSTINDSPEPISFSWEIKSVPAPLKGHRPVSSITIDKNKIDSSKWEAVTDTLFGSSSKEPTLPTPDELVSIVTDSYPRPRTRN